MSGKNNVYSKGWHIDSVTVDNQGHVSFAVHKTKGRRRISILVHSVLDSPEKAENFDRQYLTLNQWYKTSDYQRLNGWFEAMCFTAENDVKVAIEDKQ